MAVRARKHDLGRTQMFAVKNILQKILVVKNILKIQPGLTQMFILLKLFVETKTAEIFPVSIVWQTCLTSLEKSYLPFVLQKHSNKVVILSSNMFRKNFGAHARTS